MSFRKKQSYFVLRTTLTISISITILVILLGCLYNIVGEKYSKALPHSKCHKELIILSVPDSHYCCDYDINEYSWVCIGSFSKLSKYITSVWSYIIPLFPFFSNVFTDLYHSFQKPLNNTRIKVENISNLDAHFIRFILYAFIFIFRMVKFNFILYLYIIFFML